MHLSLAALDLVTKVCTKLMFDSCLNHPYITCIQSNFPPHIDSRSFACHFAQVLAIQALTCIDGCCRNHCHVSHLVKSLVLCLQAFCIPDAQPC